MVKIDLIPSVLWKKNSISLHLSTRFCFRDKASPETCSLLIVDGRWDGMRLEPRKIAKWSISTRNQEFVERYQATYFLFFSSCKLLAVNDRSQIPSSRLEFGLGSSKFGETSYYESWSRLLAAQPCRFFVPASIKSPTSIYAISKYNKGTHQEPSA